MPRAFICLTLLVTLAGCSGPFLGGLFGGDGAATPDPASAPGAAPAIDTTPRPAPRRETGTLDTAIAEAEALAEAERTAEAARPAPGPEAGPLGETVAALGDPTLSGLWLETPLVEMPQDGRIVDVAGNAVNVRLIPTGGAPGSGSRISLAAMRVLGTDLTALVALQVFARG